MGGWIALAAVILLGARSGRYKKDGRKCSPSFFNSILALGSWILIVGWFGFNVMSAQRLDAISGLVAINSLMAMVGGTITANAIGKNDPGFLHNGPLAGLVAICAGSDIVHPVSALVIGGIAGAMFVYLFTYTQNKLKVDDVLGVWPLHGFAVPSAVLQWGYLVKMARWFRRCIFCLTTHWYSTRDCYCTCWRFYCLWHP